MNRTREVFVMKTSHGQVNLFHLVLRLFCSSLLSVLIEFWQLSCLYLCIMLAFLLRIWYSVLCYAVAFVHCTFTVQLSQLAGISPTSFHYCSCCQLYIYASCRPHRSHNGLQHVNLICHCWDHPGIELTFTGIYRYNQRYYRMSEERLGT